MESTGHEMFPVSLQRNPGPIQTPFTLRQLYQTGKLRKSGLMEQPEASQYLNKKICAIRGNVVQLPVDGVITAANTELSGSHWANNIDSAVHQAGGQELRQACRALRGCAVGSAKATNGHGLAATWLIHAVAPVFGSAMQGERGLQLRSAYLDGMRCAVDHRCRTIAISCLSIGPYGFPTGTSALIAFEAIKEFLLGPSGHSLRRVVLVVTTPHEAEVYARCLPRYFPPTRSDLGLPPTEPLLPALTFQPWGPSGYRNSGPYGQIFCHPAVGDGQNGVRPEDERVPLEIEDNDHAEDPVSIIAGIKDTFRGWFACF
ncbi:hypothetical protein Z517_09351 [Fonsecaea pedrosoi CBS 271.37]|uniref:Macro domain-containing protein n=1 Tax=Fonsecaea pedrosoi CBS 271.37 TaxID=1442368 RepID=A0A0D2ERM5_9EURO|nr:uncharacterized protein Z517_09351 [Fonsecaea pedrosoi CBS 271.37]KIW76907.1 hypothetical protein Z517_09351 [Fonsecaea pedrosoi CBS 271.37]